MGLTDDECLFTPIAEIQYFYFIKKLNIIDIDQVRGFILSV